MKKHLVLAHGREWSRQSVVAALGSKGLEEQEAQEMLFRIENKFVVLSGKLGCQAEWSIRFSEVLGMPEDLQFDIDLLRERAIHEVFEMWRNNLI